MYVRTIVMGFVCGHLANNDRHREHGFDLRTRYLLLFARWGATIS